MAYKFVSKCEEDTIELAENFESEKFKNMVICLSGDLGTGKTLFAKSFANALGIDETVTSPTFNIIKEYDGEMPFYHMDVYRLEGTADDLEIEEYYDKDGVVIIEWADTIIDHLPTERLDIFFDFVDENTRVITIEPHGKKYQDLCERVL